MCPWETVSKGNGSGQNVSPIIRAYRNVHAFKFDCSPSVIKAVNPLELSIRTLQSRLLFWSQTRKLVKFGLNLNRIPNALATRKEKDRFACFKDVRVYGLG